VQAEKPNELVIVLTENVDLLSLRSYDEKGGKMLDIMSWGQ
jgi:hypothetical protein